MKLAVLLSLIATATILAEDATVETSKTPTPAEANRDAQRKLEANQQSKKLLEQNPITYSGFLVDLSRAERKSRLLSLRQPVDPKNDARNLFVSQRTDRPKGFVFFALDF